MLDLFQPSIPAAAPTRRVTPLADEAEAVALAARRANAAIARAAKAAKARTPEQRRQGRLEAAERYRRSLGMKPRVRLTPEQRLQYHRDRHQRQSADPTYLQRKAAAARRWRAYQRILKEFLMGRLTQNQVIAEIHAQMQCIPLDLPLLEPRPTLHTMLLEPDAETTRQMEAEGYAITREPLVYDAEAHELYVSPIYFGAEPMLTYARAVQGGHFGVPIDTADGLIALLPTALLRRWQRNKLVLRGVFQRFEQAAAAHANGRVIDPWTELDDGDL